LAVDVRIVDDGRKEIDGLDDGQVVGETINARVVVRLGADEQVRVADRG